MMTRDVELIEYSKKVDFYNSLTHGIGAFLSLPALVLLIMKAEGARETFAAAVYCFSIFAVYFVSALYHGLPIGENKRKARLLDHLTVPLLIAGTATPCALITLYEISHMHCFFVLSAGWLCYFFGLFAKLFFFKKLKNITVAVYIISGAVMIASALPLLDKITKEGFNCLILGCASYLVGAVFCGLGIKKEWYHVVFHIFVFIGSLIHYFAVYIYVF